MALRQTHKCNHLPLFDCTLAIDVWVPVEGRERQRPTSYRTNFVKGCSSLNFYGTHAQWNEIELLLKHVNDIDR